MKIKGILIVILTAMLVNACGNVDATADDPLNSTSWELVYYRKSTVLEGPILTANFDGGEVKGSAGCNSYSGSYQVEGDTISFGPIASTLMACMDPEGIMDQETMFLAWLADAQTFWIKDNQLMIFRSDGEALTFIPVIE
jgi:heat shock protein HslJ